MNVITYITDGTVAQKSDAGLYSDYWINHPDAIHNIYNPVNTISQDQQDISYTAFNKIKIITEGDFSINIKYGTDQQRRKAKLRNQGNLVSTKFYFPGYEKEISGTNTREIYYINAPSGLCALYVVENGMGTMYYVYKDHLGSILKVTDGNGNTFEQSFDAWGRNRNPSDWTYSNITSVPQWLYRGFTGHEHLKQFSLINMNGRVYDPVLGVMLSPDNFVQQPDNTQNYNRYAYCVNNPLSYVDKDGNFFWVPFIIGALVGAYAGYQVGLSNGAHGLSMIGYTFGGAAVGGLAASFGYSVAISGMPFANTAAIASGSFLNSFGMSIISNENNVSLNFGVGSIDFASGNFKYLGKPGNSSSENILFGLGALANIADLLVGFKPGETELRTEYDSDYNSKGTGKDLIGHSQLSVKGKPVVDWGPARGYSVDDFDDWVPGANSFEDGALISSDKMIWDPLTLKGVNISRISNWSPKGNYNLLFNSCVTQTSRALNLSGAFNIGIHPYLLHGQMYLRTMGVRPILYSYLFTK
jgi:RHS repeat-associated protein